MVKRKPFHFNFIFVCKRNCNSSDMEEFFARMKSLAAKVDSEVDDLERKAESIRYRRKDHQKCVPTSLILDLSLLQY